MKPFPPRKPTLIDESASPPDGAETDPLAYGRMLRELTQNLKQRNG